MGVLEDAIREHLELKRQHGASDEEVTRQEAEVLGAARRAAADAEAKADAAEQSAPSTESGSEGAAEEPADGVQAAESEPIEHEQPGEHGDPLAAEADPPEPVAPEPGATDLPAPEGDLPEPVPPEREASDLSVPDADLQEPAPPASPVAGSASDTPPEPVEATLIEPSAPGAEPVDEPTDPPVGVEPETGFDDPAGLEPEVSFDEEEPGVAPPMPGPHAADPYVGPAEPAVPDLEGGEDPKEPDAGVQPPADTPPRGSPAVTEEADPAQEAPSYPESGPSDPSEDDSDDVLEETPDFLQETPEHDRLWFEQKPPRDFDFE